MNNGNTNNEMDMFNSNDIKHKSEDDLQHMRFDL